MTPDPFSSRELGGVWARDYLTSPSTLTAGTQPWIRVGIELFTRLFLPFLAPPIQEGSGNQTTSACIVCREAPDEKLKTNELGPNEILSHESMSPMLSGVVRTSPMLGHNTGTQRLYELLREGGLEAFAPRIFLEFYSLPGQF